MNSLIADNDEGLLIVEETIRICFPDAAAADSAALTWLSTSDHEICPPSAFSGPFNLDISYKSNTEACATAFVPLLPKRAFVFVSIKIGLPSRVFTNMLCPLKLEA